MNCDMLKDGANSVKNLCDDLNLKNYVKKPTCFKAENGTSLDAILVNTTDFVKHCDVFPCCLSDFHHFV